MVRLRDCVEIIVEILLSCFNQRIKSYNKLKIKDSNNINCRKMTIEETKHIVYVSGTRADYGLMRSTLIELNSSDRFKLSIIVTGMHLSHKYGKTIDEIKKDNFHILGVINLNLEDNSLSGMSKSLGTCLIGISDILSDSDPDLILIQGDRGEALAGAIAGAHMNILVCHVSGGDKTGSIDDKIRNSITKFADIHLPATQFSFDRIVNGFNVSDKDAHIVGEPGLDDLLISRDISREELFSKYNIPADKELLLIIQHPVTDEFEDSANQMRMTLQAVSIFKASKLIIYPNSDAGGVKMIEIINEYEGQNMFYTLKNLPRDEFILFMKYASVLIGNSSSSIVESPTLHIPAINIGNRQKGRMQSQNIINVDYNETEIVKAIEIALNDEKFKIIVREAINPYGDGKTGVRIKDILTNILF